MGVGVAEVPLARKKKNAKGKWRASSSSDFTDDSDDSISSNAKKSLPCDPDCYDWPSENDFSGIFQVPKPPQK